MQEAKSTSERPKWPELIPVSLAWSMPRSIATLPHPWSLDRMLVHCRVTPSSVFPVPTNLYTWVKAAETKQSKIPCLRKQRDRWVRLEPQTSRSTQPHTPLYGLQVWPLLTYLCQLCSPWDLWQLFQSSPVSPLPYFSYHKCMAK